MASAKGQARSEPATPIIREDPSHDQTTPTQPSFSINLTATIVRDFAYSPSHPLHHGPPPIPSIGSTPGSARNSGFFAGANGIGSFLGWWNPGGMAAASPGGRRLSDSAATRDPRGGSNHPPPLKFHDGPPWFEDDDLVSPVVISQKRGSGKRGSSMSIPQRRGSRDKMSAISEIAKPDVSNGAVPVDPETLGEPGGTYHPATGEYFGEPEEEEEEDDEYESDDDFPNNHSRYSKDYQFSIADPDEEMHGKAVALFDFKRENDNELELVEGQVIWVSYRHGQGWLVAEDPRTGESGLVPEEYVRLFKEMAFHHSPEDMASPPESESPTTKTGTSPPKHTTAVQSHFSTSSKDLERYPHPEQLLDPSYRLGSPPPNINRDSNNGTTTHPPPSSTSSSSSQPPSRTDSASLQKPDPMDTLADHSGGGYSSAVSANAFSSPTTSTSTAGTTSTSASATGTTTTIDREQFAIQQRKLEDGKVLNGKDKSEQEEYQLLHHKSPSISSSGKASPATPVVPGGGLIGGGRDKDGDSPMVSAGSAKESPAEESARGRAVEAR